MSHLITDRKTLFWGGQNILSSTGALVLFAQAVPGLPSEGVAVQPSNDAVASWSFPTGISTDVLQAYGQKITVPKDVVAIGIAPDSSIAQCDLWIAGRGDELSRHRLSPGNPYIGCPDTDYALVTIPNSIGYLAQSAYTAVADCSMLEGSARFPLRLELFRGCNALPMRTHRRSPLVAVFSALDIDTGENGGIRQFFACVDGRNRISVQLFTDNANFTIACDAMEAKPNNANNLTANAIALALDDAGSMSLAITAGNNALITLDGNPITILRITATSAANDGRIQCRVMAWDD